MIEFVVVYRAYANPDVTPPVRMQVGVTIRVPAPTPVPTGLHPDAVDDIRELDQHVFFVDGGSHKPRCEARRSRDGWASSPLDAFRHRLEWASREMENLDGIRDRWADVADMLADIIDGRVPAGVVARG